MTALGRDMLLTARRLTKAHAKKPKQADLRRAVSTSYYALFHSIAQMCADLLAGAGSGRSDGAWRQVYRALDHGPAKEACKRAADLKFPQAVVDAADQFVLLQEERHRADYAPDARYSRAQVLQIVQDAETAIEALRRAP